MSSKNKLFQQTLTNNSDAEFRAWGSFIATVLQSGGIIKTTDTGQIDFTTVTKPTVVSTAQGYEIRRMSDTLQSSKPVFIKIEYGSHSTLLNPSIWVTVGTGSNGSGTITGILLNRTQVAVPSVLTSTTSWMVSADTNRFTFSMNYLVAANMSFALERTKNTDGTDSGDGLLLFYLSNATSSSIWSYLPFLTTIPPTELIGNALIPTSGTTVSGSNVGIFPPIYFNFGENVNPGMNMFAYQTTVVSTDSVVTAQVYGASRDYLALGIRNAITAVDRNSNAMMLRYE